MKYEIYCDESCWEALYDKKSHQYAVIGGVWIPSEFRQEGKTIISNQAQIQGRVFGKEGGEDDVD